MTSQAVQILYVSLFFDTQSQNAEVKLVTSQKCLMTFYKLNIPPKMLRFWKVALVNFKIGKVLITFFIVL